MTALSHRSAGFKVPSLERGLIIMEFLVEQPRPFGARELAKELNLPLNSVYRIVNTLWWFGYLDRDDRTKEFTLSRKLFSMAYGSKETKTLLENSLDVMRQLRDATGEEVTISIARDGEGVILAEIPSVHPFRTVSEPGSAQPAHASAATKAIYAFLPDAEREAHIQRMKMVRYTENTITSKEVFRRQLALVCRNGYAVDDGEGPVGANCVAAPIVDHRGQPVAALTVTGPATRMPAGRFKRIGRVVQAHALRISQRLGFRTDDRGPLRGAHPTSKDSGGLA
jgi:IclR family transcriptional regulator, acetate operon repressor